MRVAGLLHDVGHGPFGHFFDDNFLADFDLTHEKVGQRIIREELGDLIRGLRRSPSGPFEDGERIDPEWICYLMGKSYTVPTAEHPRWLAHLKPLLSGIYTADNMDYVLRDSYMCGVAVGPIDIERIMYYSFFSEKGLTLDRGGIQAFIMFLNARFYLYTNVYYHRTTRGIDLHLKEIFRETMKLVFPVRPQQGAPALPQHDRVDPAGGGRPLGPLGRRRTAGPSAASGARCSIATSSGACPTRWCSTSSSRGGARAS